MVKAKLLLGSVCWMGLAYAMPALAQEAPAPAPQASDGAAPPSEAEVEEIVVTGIRGTLTSARELKRNSGQIQESIVAEDIGKLPDTSIASTLQRIPGIQLARDSRGQGNTYVVHGLKQVTTTIDGRQIFSSTNRAANLLELSADILSGIDVYKTATADQIEGGLGGLINIHSAQPFNFDGLHVAGTLSGYYSDVNDKLTPRTSLVLSNRFDTGIGEIGVLVGGQFERVFSGGYQTSTNAYADNRNLFDRDGDGVFPNDAGDAVNLPSQVRGRYETGRLTRSSVYGAIQWRPVEELTLYANAMRFNTKSTSATQQLSVQTDGARGVGSSFQFKDSNPNVPDSYSLTNALIRSSRGASDFNQHTNSYAGGFDWKSDRFTLGGQVSYVDSTAPFYSRSVVLQGRAPTANIDLSTNTPDFSVGGVDLTSPTAYTGQTTYSDLGQQAYGDETSSRLDATYKFDNSPITAISAGVRYAKRQAINEVYSIGQNVTLTQPITSVTQQTPDELFFDRTASTNQWLTFQEKYLFDKRRTRALVGVPSFDPVYPPTNYYNYRETAWAAYGKADFAFDLGLHFDGNVGLRYVKTTNKQLVYIANGSNFDPVRGESSYENWLPSVNVRAELTKDLYLRLAYSKALTRPEFGNLSPAVVLSVLNGTGSAGNPDLAPTKADQYDASLEFYFGKSNYAAVSVFQKDVVGFAQKFAQNETIDGEIFLITRPRNSGPGTIKGFEIFYQQFFDFLPGPLSGLGFQGNFTYADSSLPVLGRPEMVAADLLSKYAFNVTGIYELGPVSAQLSYNWRSKSVQTNFADSAGRALYNAPLEQMDFSISYAVNENVSVKFDAVNLLNAYQRQYYGTSDIPAVSNQYDRNYQLGVRVNF